MAAVRIGSLLAMSTVLSILSLDRVMAQQVMHMSVENSLYAEAMNEVRRLSAFEEEEVGHEVANEMLVAQGQLKKATTTTMLESYTQGQVVDQTKSVVTEEDLFTQT